MDIPQIILKTCRILNPAILMPGPDHCTFIEHNYSEVIDFVYSSQPDLEDPPFLKDVIYSFMRDTEREAETQAEEEAGSLREPIVELNPGITTGAEGKCSTTEPPRHP